ncbi:hypothetical protein Tco_0078921 [Tanacetum coccineum]
MPLSPKKRYNLADGTHYPSCSYTRCSTLQRKRTKPETSLGKVQRKPVRKYRTNPHSGKKNPFSNLIVSINFHITERMKVSENDKPKETTEKLGRLHYGRDAELVFRHLHEQSSREARDTGNILIPCALQNSIEGNFQDHSNPLFEFDDKFKSSTINALFDKMKEDVEITNSNVSDEPVLLNTLYPISEPTQEEIDIFLVPDDLIPPGVENDDSEDEDHEIPTLTTKLNRQSSSLHRNHRM